MGEHVGDFESWPTLSDQENNMRTFNFPPEDEGFRDDDEAGPVVDPDRPSSGEDGIALEIPPEWTGHLALVGYAGR